jgi:hypothetical protein
MQAQRRRPLTREERDVLEFLLGVTPTSDRPFRVDVLRQQVDRASVALVWDCCPSIELAVGPDDPPPLAESGGPLIAAKHSSEPFELELFVTADHRLRALELVRFGEELPTAFPPLAEFETPVWYEGWQPLVSTKRMT